MFEEAPFEEEETPHQDNAQPAASAMSGGGGEVLERFHRPGDAAFCSVAGAQRDEESRFDTRTVNGDMWVSTDCHCSRCECLRFLAKAGALSVSPLVVVLLDLDNFGFNQLKSIAPARDGEDRVDVLDHLFVWSFFGSCFGRHHAQWPTEETVSTRFPNTNSVRPTIWQRLVSARRVQFTPCSGHSQGADGVIAEVIPMVTARYHTVLVSGDRALLQRFAPPARPLGRKSKRENEDDQVARHLSCLDVDELDKRFVPFWRSLSRIVRAVLEDTADTP